MSFPFKLSFYRIDYWSFYQNTHFISKVAEKRNISSFNYLQMCLMATVKIAKHDNYLCVSSKTKGSRQIICDTLYTNMWIFFHLNVTLFWLKCKAFSLIIDAFWLKCDTIWLKCDTFWHKFDTFLLISDALGHMWHFFE